VISELPRSRSEPTADLGITRREIIWRIAGLRPSVPDLRAPRWLDPVILVLVLGYLLAGIASAPFSLEEAVQTSLAGDASVLVRHPASLLPGGAVSPTQESVRLAYGSFTRYSSAIGWYASGGRHTQAPVDLLVPGPSPTRVPDWNLLVAARTGPALMAMIAVLVIFLLTRRLLGRAAALAVVLIFGLHPTVALISRQSVDAGFTMTAGLALIVISMGISGTVAKGDDPGLGAWTALAALTGVTLASGPTSPPYVAGAVAFCGAGLVGRQRRRRRELLARRPVATTESGGPAGWMAATALASVLIWVAVSPALWGWLPERLDTRHAERATLVGERLLPDPGPQDFQARVRAGVGVITDPFLTPSRTESAGLASSPPAELALQQTLDARQARYERSWWSGLPLGTSIGPLPRPLTGLFSMLIGAVLTLAAGVGAVALWRTSRRQATAVFGWVLATAGWLVLWPSGQVDHAAPLIALGCVLAAGSVPVLLGWLRELTPSARSDADEPGDVV
jgi:Dolichyl-phosphate-mannose-protein mannosyltransferase